MKIASWNVNSLRVRLEQVLSWLKAAEPDVLGLQETKVGDERFPRQAFSELGYHCAFSGQPAYNGVALLSRAPIENVLSELTDFPDPERRVMAGSIGAVRVLNLYVPNGRRVDSEKYRYKLNWLAALGGQLRHELREHDRVVVMGDFNIAPEDRDVHDPAAWEGKILCSPRERAALAGLLKLGLRDTFRLFDQEEERYSWWDYRAAAFRRNRGLRIDLILACEQLSGRCTAAGIDTAPRKLERPSDHAPVFAEFDIP